MIADVLSDLLRSVRLSGAVFFEVDATSPWVAEAPPSSEVAPLVMPGAQHVIEYHVVTDGACWAGIVNADTDPVRLTRGSVIIFPRGDPHVLSSAPRMRAAPDLGVYRQPAEGETLPFRLEPAGGGPDATRLICGFLGCDNRPFNPLLQALPRLLHIDDGCGARGGWLGSLIEATVRESRNSGAGSVGVLEKLSELIFMEAVRLHAETLPPETAGWLGALRDPQVGRALMLLHGDPGRPWTLPGLAREAGVSRTVLAERFTARLGMPPMTYLTRWRMQLAAGMLLHDTACIADVAVRIGYESEASFSRAFKRCTGLPPASWRAAVSPRGRGPP
ncbi:AraC family transcriptional regulator [Skermanella rosea]|uniref:AraC family transcriptional regulator n=1 Tax=Skermanella rosea TaxID=1817965 RepID=UPI001934168F|nr:AraC family transcriptional regulator [Skermanella rosea]UEM05484.1 AraC family transcriptional regulator [Skermanella rosea]